MYHGGNWNKIANLDKNPNNDTSKKEVEKQIKKYFNNLKEYDGIEPNNVIYEKVLEQYKNADKNDFAHMGATVSTYFHSSIYKTLSFLDGFRQEKDKVFNGVTGVEANAGYIGDICGNRTAIPSLNKADYAADVDAVNLYYRFKNNKDKSLYIVFSTYYEEIENGKTNRAEEFLKNITISELKKNRIGYKSYISKYEDNNNLEYTNRLNYFDNFVEHIVESENEFTPQKYYDYFEYDSVTKKTINTLDKLENKRKDGKVSWHEKY